MIEATPVVEHSPIEHGPVERHPFAIRHLTVTSVRQIGISFVRVTLEGADLDGFASTGPADHVKVFFPDPASGELAVPVMTPDGPARPSEGTVISRDYTPRSFRPATADSPASLELDFVVHGDTAPATAWASKAKVGDALVVAGPRGSRPAPTGMTKVLLGADESALPAVARWIAMLPENVEISAFIELDHDSDAVYLDPEVVQRAQVIWLSKGDGALERAIRGMGDSGAIDDGTYIWVAGETGGLVAIRRYLRRELGLPASRVTVDGYWKRGVAGRDHHAPIDPSDPED
ncbi:NADPH-dependent ferric siderophore reductase [Homoserinimonas aerilata]|uniref:NADPH-dependent ferric siderophore reductase n=1 Tax=Homoserinimonas aerilata TaxID=1162970 RepID=A0A542YII9_9MICO|nr:siderophore-interacting protein [Homoserinimonas aerilata]TQL47814.1 NADPH-dependent ferric siderophore reductase [Homoserinimonas aerilata]